jgi:hypothetical protein
MDIVIKIYDDADNVIFEQTLLNKEYNEIYEHAENLRIFFEAKGFETFDYNGNKNETPKRN